MAYVIGGYPYWGYGQSNPYYGYWQGMYNYPYFGNTYQTWGTNNYNKDRWLNNKPVVNTWYW